MNVDGIAYLHADKRAWNLTVEGPVTEGGSFGQSPFDLDAEEIDGYSLRFTPANRRRQIGRLTPDISLNECLRRRPTGDDELALHAGKLVSGDAGRSRRSHLLSTRETRLSRSRFSR